MRKLPKNLFRIVFISVIISNCSKSPRCWGSDKNKGIIKNTVDIDCLPNSEKSSFVINNDSIYKANFESTCNLPIIDFNSFTLLGLYASGGCETKFIREVEKKGDEKIHYSIKVKNCGLCKKLAFSYNWVTVPKITNTAVVTFEVIEK